jgi:hypothetical protein
MNGSQQKIANISSNSESLQIPRQGLGKNPFLKKSGAKNIVGLSL